MSGDGWLRYIQIDKDLDAQSAIRVLAHEVGHAIADRTGSVVRYEKGVPVRVPPMDGLDKQLRVIYNDLNNPVLAQRRANAGGKDVDISTSRNLRSYGPEERGYPKKEVADELWAEAIRAYMADPNYLKTVAPDVAAAIRKAVNANPSVKKIIQFNGIGGTVAFGLNGAGRTADEE